mgnify:CR=1 FL=1
MESIQRYFKRTDKVYLFLCIFSSVMAVVALSSWAAKQGNGFAVDEVTGAITGIGDYRRALVQGISALMNFDPGADFVTNRSNMTDALGRVQSGQITFAVRDSEYDGHKIKQGEILAMDNGKIVFTEKDVTKALTKLTKRLISGSSSYVTVIYGSDVTDEAANGAYEQLRA